MSNEIIAAIASGVMLLLMMLGVPIAICISSVGLAGFAIIFGIDKTLSLAGLMPFSAVASYTLSLLPVFLLMGEFADISGMMRDSYRAANAWLGNLPGGLAMASIFGAAAFSAVSGSSMACAAIMTRVALPSLLEHKYDPKLATGALAAGGTLGNLIPPGVAIIFYAVITEASIGKLLVAVTLPGIILTVMYLIQIYIQCRLNPSLGPRGGSSSPWQKLVAFKDAAPMLVVFALVMVGIWLGIYTPNEAGAIGTVGAFLWAVYRRTVSGRTVLQALKNVILTSGMAFAIVISAQIFATFIALSGLSRALAAWVLSFNLPAIGVVILIMIIYIILGTAMDTLTMVLLTLPFFLPLLNQLGIDLIWFGVLVIIQMELSQITPPVGLNLFVVAVMVKEKNISIGTIFRGVMPFCYTMVVFNALVIAFPQLALFLVGTMR
jgi:tripartite ATP-independent transporter DctM subunit